MRISFKTFICGVRVGSLGWIVFEDVLEGVGVVLAGAGPALAAILSVLTMLGFIIFGGRSDEHQLDEEPDSVRDSECRAVNCSDSAGECVHRIGDCAG